MNNAELIELIKNLTKSDKKNLAQKTIKLFSEAGELSGKVLPYVNAFATRHNFSTKNDIIEEIADIILVTLSIGYDIGMTDEELHYQLIKKTNKWATLQNDESKLTDKIPFEIHITIDSANIEDFKSDCKECGVKPILLDLYNSKTVINDIMTSSKFSGDNRSVLEEVKRIEDFFNDKKYSIKRSKIETVPWHPASPKTENDAMPKNCYFESHIPIIVNTEYVGWHGIISDLINKFTESYKQYSVRISRNALKKYDKTSSLFMLTIRSAETYYDHFSNAVTDLKSKFEEYLPRDVANKNEIEFSIYDTNIAHDNKWMRE